MTLDLNKVENYLVDYLKMDFKKLRKDLLFLPAICHLQLGNFKEAKRLFELSFKAMLAPPHMWKLSNQPEHLVDVFVLSASKQYCQDVKFHLRDFQRNPPGSSPYIAFSYVALYAYSVIEILLPSGEPIKDYIEGLLKKPKIKDGYAMGQTLRAIVDKDQAIFEEGMRNLLKAHEGMAKYGGLRESSEGFLCMPAMTLAHLALRNGMQVEFENDYLSIGYLNFLLQETKI